MIGFLAALTWERHARRQERRKLDEQAERQRLRAPEPGPDVEPQASPAQLPLTHRQLSWLLAIPVTLLVIFGMVTSPTAFWIGVGVLFGAIGATVPLWADRA
jgi:hypothetical protein